MEQIGRSATQETWGYLRPCRYVLHDRDTKFCASFRSALASGGVKTIPLPAQSPNLNAFAERWVHYHHEETIKGKATSYFFQLGMKNGFPRAIQLSVAADSAACSNTTGTPHEYFYRTAKPACNS